MKTNQTHRHAFIASSYKLQNVAIRSSRNWEKMVFLRMVIAASAALFAAAFCTADANAQAFAGNGLPKDKQQLILGRDAVLVINNNVLMMTDAPRLNNEIKSDNTIQRQTGSMFEYISVQPANVNAGVEGGLRKENYTIVLTEAEIAPQFPGGEKGWQAFVERNRSAIKGIRSYRPIVLTFIVDAAGNVKEVEALNDNGDGLAQEAIRIVKLSPAWSPAIHQGFEMVYRKYITINF